MTYPCRWFVFVFSITLLYLVDVEARDFEIFEPVWINHLHLGKANILIDDSFTWIILSYIIEICTYQVGNHRVPHIYYCYIIGW